MTIAWVLGSGGLLGTALCSALRREGIALFFPAERFRWGSGPELDAQIDAAVSAFANQVNSVHRWQMYWAAGVGTMGSSQDDMSVETLALKKLLCRLASESRLMAAPGAIAFASSAGAIYAGGPDAVITENTPGGMPARPANSAKASAESGVSVAGLQTKVQPAASAGPALRVIMALGKFQGVMAATTPTGCLMTIMRPLGQGEGLVSP